MAELSEDSWCDLILEEAENGIPGATDATQRPNDDAKSSLIPWDKTYSYSETDTDMATSISTYAQALKQTKITCRTKVTLKPRSTGKRQRRAVATPRQRKNKKPSNQAGCYNAQESTKLKGRNAFKRNMKKPARRKEKMMGWKRLR